MKNQLLVIATFIFSYTSAQTFSLNPNKGFVGTDITLNIASLGITDSAGLQVLFKPYMKGIVTAFSATNVSVKVPAGCQRGKVLVNIAGITYQSETDFSPTFTQGEVRFETTDFGGSFGFPRGANFYLATADIDGDRRVDFAFTPSGEKGIEVVLNKMPYEYIGQPVNVASFQNPNLLAADTSFYDVELADLNSDGKPEVIASSLLSNNVFVFQNNSSPNTLNFAAPIRLTVQAPRLSQLAIADLDSDGKPEIIATSGRVSKLFVFKNANLSGPLSAQDFSDTLELTPEVCNSVGTYSIQVNDFNGDKRPDLACLVICDSSILIYENSSTSIGTLSFKSPLRIKVSYPPSNLVSADFNNDGRYDLAVCHNNPFISILENKGNLNQPISVQSFLIDTFSNKQQNGDFVPYYYSIEAGDFNGDGFLDLVSTMGAGELIVVNANKSEPNGPINFAPSNNGELNIIVTADFATATADFNMDGRLDIVVSDDRNVNSVPGDLRLITNLSGFPTRLQNQVNTGNRLIHFYPNPASNFITIEGGNENTLVMVYDMLGSLKLNTVLNSNGNVSLAELPVGNYVLLIKQNGSLTRTVFIKE